ncbi:MAG: hypothetical protein KF852_14850 [Saprospiraceae bacterium]|nr:hypothetical protein [Saprospiraceae bacterium]
MKKQFVLSFALIFTLFSLQSFGAVVVNPQAAEMPEAAASVQQPELSIGDFLNMTPKQFEEQSGQKMSWTKKLAFKMVQKKMKKKAAKGELELSAAAGNTMSLLSLILGAGGFVLLWVVGLLGLLMGIAGFVLGLVAMKKEGSNVMNLLGVIFGAATVLMLILAVLLVSSWAW